jgi:MFS family permease
MPSHATIPADIDTPSIRTGNGPDRPDPRRRGFLDRIGIPPSLHWGFVAVLLFMTGTGVESNFISPFMASTFASQGAASTAATIIALYGVSALVASYFSGVLSDLWGPKKVMMLGFAIWAVFEAAFLISVQVGSVPLTAASYALRGLGFPLFVFAFLSWVNHVVSQERNAVAVGWFYVAYTGGLPTLGSLVALFAIPALGGGLVGEYRTMLISGVLVVAAFVVLLVGANEKTGLHRIAQASDSTGRVLMSGITAAIREPRLVAGMVIRLINTAPEYGMFIIMPAVVATELGWGQSRWLTMTVIVYGANIVFNAIFGAIGDKIGWIRTVKWFGIVAAAGGLLAWWYVAHLVPAGSDWGFWVTTAAGATFGILLAGFTPMGAVIPALTPKNRGAAMSMYATAAGGAVFAGNLVVAAVLPWGGNTGVVWAFVALYALAFVGLTVIRFPDPVRDELEQKRLDSRQEKVSA